MTTYSCVYIFVGAFALLAVASAAESSNEDSFAEATSFVQAFMSEHAVGGGGSACRKVADDSIQVIKTECDALQKTVDTAAKANQKCCNSGKDAVCSSQKSIKGLNAKKNNCYRGAHRMGRFKIKLTSTLNDLKGGKCKSIKGSSAYKKMKYLQNRMMARCSKLSGAVNQGKRTLANVIRAAAASRRTCTKNAKTRLRRLFKTADKACNSDKNKRAFTRAQHMKCVLDGKSLKNCDVGSSPSVKKTALSKLTCDAMTARSSCKKKKIKEDHVWGITHWGVLYSRARGQWNKKAGAMRMLTDISVSTEGVLWAVNVHGELYNRQMRGQLKRIKAPIKLKKIAVGVRRVWGVTNEGEIYTRSGGVVAKWKHISGPDSGKMKEIAAGERGVVWGVNSQDDVYTRRGVMGEWKKVEGKKLKKISAGEGGVVWGVNSQDEVYTRPGVSGEWKFIPVKMKEISVGAKGVVWGVNRFKSVFTRPGVDGGVKAWKSISTNGRGMVKVVVNNKNHK